ncbi:MAG: hypothetical protein K2J67_10765, partial [Lachnospiraceae bacterium]|nr:hypothetical protein [Lachnospiraceae bacterium]
LACLFGILAPWRGEQAYSQAKMLTQGSENYRYLTYSVEDLDVEIHAGLSSNNVRSGRYAPVHLVIKNRGEDFEGIFRFYLDARDMGTSERTVVDKAVQIAAGETKEYSCFLSCSSSKLQTALCDKKGELLNDNNLEKQILSLGSYAYGVTIFGLISEDNSTLEYLAAQDDIRAESLQDWMLTGDWRMLDSLDVLVINQFDTTQFSEKQIAAFNEWVRRGGTLIFGTGAQPEKTLKAFSGNLLQGTIGSSKRISTKYGTDLDISELQLENMKSILNQGDDMLVGQMDYGKGSVLVASFDLAGNLGDKMSSAIGSICYLNMCMDRKAQIQIESNMLQDNMIDVDYYDMYDELSLSKALRATEVNGLPNVMLYAVLLLLYAIFIGPVLYSILRKRGKREWLWRLIPISAVVCSVLIYLIGTGTRVKHPYINYLSQIDLSNENVSLMKTYMTITSPNNDSFDLELTDTDVTPYHLDENYYYDDQTTNLDYQSRIEYLDNQTILHMENMSAFSSQNFQQKQEVKQRGRIQFADINLSYDDLHGIVTNQSGYDLEQCAIICNGDLLSLGDLKRGESVSLDQLDVSEAWIREVGVYGSIASKITGYDTTIYNNNSDIPGLRRTVMLNRYCGIDASDGGYYFYGFLAADQSTEFSDQYEEDLYGETAVVQQLNHNDLGEAATDRIADLDLFASNLPDGLDGVGLSIGSYKVTYNMEAVGSPHLLQLSYQRSGNSEFELMEQIAASPADAPYVEGRLFLGKVYAVNQQTGKQEELFDAGKENVVTDLSKYMDKNQNLELVYIIEALDETQYPNQVGFYDSFGLPRLVLERRVES